MRSSSIVYSWDQLIAQRPADLSARTSEIPAEIWRKTNRRCSEGQKKWRKRGGSRQQRFMEKSGYKLCLPSFIMGNMRLLVNKAVELTALIGGQRKYRECSLMCSSVDRATELNLFFNRFDTVGQAHPSSDSPLLPVLDDHHQTLPTLLLLLLILLKPLHPPV